MTGGAEEISGNGDSGEQKKSSTCRPGKDSSSRPYSESLENAVELVLNAEQFPIERYKAVRELGKGGGGTVYLCWDRLLGKQVAVKTLQKLTSEQLISFQREARATSKLSHPAIVQLLDFGPTRSTAPYMVLEYFDGMTLEQFIQRYGVLTLPAFKSVFSRIASALALAHSMGVFHRDLKPSNILIGGVDCDQAELKEAQPSIAPAMMSTLEVKLIDFGIARIREDAEPVVAAQRNTIAGTPAYMSPDNIQGAAYDARAEIYSLGCVMFESLTGKPPFAGKTVLEIFNLHVSSPAPSLLQTSQTVYPNDLEELLAKCLAKDPGERIASMEELKGKIDRLGEGDADRSEESDSSHLTTHRPDRRNNLARLPQVKLGLAVSVLMLLLGIVVAAALFFHLFGTDKNRYLQTSSAGTAQDVRQGSAGRKAGAKEPGEIASDAAGPAQLNALEKLSGDNAKLEQSASQGDAQAQSRLGYKYLHGDGSPVNYKKAMDLLLKSAAKGNVEAELSVAEMYSEGLGVKADGKKALYWYRTAAAIGNSIAENNVGRAYLRGIGVPVNIKEATKWFARSSQHGNSMATCNLAYTYAFAGNLKEAARLYKAAAEQGNPVAQCQLGNMYRSGSGVRKDYKRAIYWYRQAVLKGHPAGQNLLADMYRDGIGVEKDYDRAFDLYQESAGQGNQAAFNGLGHMYDFGLGVKQDHRKAVQCYLESASHNFISAQANLAVCYHNGLGVPRDDVQAAKWALKAAKQGYAPAQRLLSTMYARGLGVKRDLKESEKWKQLAASKVGSNHFPGLQGTEFTDTMQPTWVRKQVLQPP